jgi:DNA-binding LacI/PurR family transcriptional regulator
MPKEKHTIAEKPRRRPSKQVFAERCDRMFRELSRRISSGELRDGDFLPTESDLIREYSLSRSSVRKVLDRLEEQYPLTRHQGRGVMLGTDVSQSPAAGGVAILVGEELRRSSAPYVDPALSRSDVLHAMELRLNAAGLRAEFFCLASSRQTPGDMVRRIVAAGHRFVVCTGADDHPQISAICRELACFGVRVLSLFQDVDTPMATVVKPNQYEVGLVATRHLVELGHRELACLCYTRNLSWNDARIAAYRDMCERHGLAASAERICQVDSRPFLTNPNSGIRKNETYRAFCDEFLSGLEATAVFCVTDDLAQGLFEAALDRGLDIPGELSVVGCDNNFQFLDLNLTTISQEFQRCGEIAVELILQSERFAPSSPIPFPRSILAPPALLRRGSTRPPAAST